MIDRDWILEWPTLLFVVRKKKPRLRKKNNPRKQRKSYDVKSRKREDKSFDFGQFLEISGNSSVMLVKGSRH